MESTQSSGENNVKSKTLTCVTCKGETSGAHSCEVCQKPCHAIGTCASLNPEDDSDEDEGFGSKVTCKGCAGEQGSKTTHANALSNTSSNAFNILMKNKKPLPVPKNKRKQSGHGKTQSAVCLVCYDQYKKDQKKNFLFARFNASSLKEHKKVHNCTDNFVSSEDPRAAEAMQTLKKLEERKLEISFVAKKQKLDPISSQNDNNSKEVGTVQKSDSQEELSSTNELPSELDIMEIASHEVINDDLLSKESISCSDSQSLTDVLPVESSSGLGTVKQKQQTSLSNFFPSLPNLPSTQDKLSLDYIADRISEKVCERLKGATADLSEKRVADAADNPNRTSPASNLTDFLHDEHEFELIGENDTWVLRCKICHSYLSNPVASSALKRKPTGDSLATGITLSSDDYSKHIQGNCPEWRRLKHRMLAHLSGSSKTHQNSSQFMKEQMKLHSRKSISIRNQLRTAIGVVQTKCAGIHYETKIAELHQAGADVGDFGHSRNLFPQMIDVACHFIDKETKEYLGTNLPNTGLPPHYYVSADKSTNYRISNQVSMVCPVVQGKKKAIPVAMNPVYTKSDGSGGKGEELADMIYDDLKTHLDIKGSRLLQMQGKVTDGQYINQPFVSKMNKPIFDILSSSGLSDDDVEILLRNMWWECHWDPAHLLDKVFSSFKEDSFVKRFLGRVALFHQIFRHGKMHSIAKETAKEADLPFRVTNAYAPQRFMSSSYLSLKRLEISYEAYVETFLDHHNEAEMRYKLRGSDFVYDLCGLLDLLWPIVQLMLKSQLEWCPGWKFPSYVRLAIAQIELFSSEILKRVPDKNASPRLNKHAEDIIEERYKSVELEPGWIIVGREENGDFIWEAREIKDCQKDLKDLADGMKRELEDRFEKGFPELSKTLQNCLDFALLFRAISGERNVQSEIPVSKATFSQFGAQEFKLCVQFVSLLPHVSVLNLALCEELSSSIFWRLKDKLIDIVWGQSFQSLFPRFFKVLETKGSLREIQLKDNSYVKSFQKAETTDFTLSDTFREVLDDGKEETVALQEQEVISALYTDADFYTSVGQEFCIIFDVMYAKTGTEAVVESFYGVVRSQKMDGGQSIKVLGDRAKVDWCFPPVLDCERALNEMASLYIDGDSTLGIKRHHVPVYQNRKSFLSQNSLSKVLARMKESKKGLSFLR